MARLSKKDEVTGRVQAYLKKAEIGDPSDFRIDVRNVARELHYSPTTIYKYDLAEEIQTSHERQFANTPTGHRISKSQANQEITQGLKETLENQRAVNLTLVIRLNLIEVNAARLGIDPEELYKLPPKPIRSVSRAGSNKKQSRRRRR
jgi:hypothetical protein